MTEAKGRYCGSKHSHSPHQWQMIGRPEGPSFKCRGRGLFRDTDIQAGAEMGDRDSSRKSSDGPGETEDASRGSKA